MNGWQRLWVVISVPWWIGWGAIIVGAWSEIVTGSAFEQLLAVAIVAAPIGLYILGLAARWVINGFRNGRNDEAR